MSNDKFRLILDTSNGTDFYFNPREVAYVGDIGVSLEYYNHLVGIPSYAKSKINFRDGRFYYSNLTSAEIAAMIMEAANA